MERRKFLKTLGKVIPVASVVPMAIIRSTEYISAFELLQQRSMTEVYINVPYKTSPQNKSTMRVHFHGGTYYYYKTEKDDLIRFRKNLNFSI